MKKMLKFLTFLVVGLLILASILWLSRSQFNDYQVDGELVLEGLKAPVTVIRDEKGMAYAQAESLEDVIFAQGFLTAQDRLFNMHLIRLMIQGRLTELVGESARETDIRHRTLGLYRLGTAHAEALSPESRRFHQRYVDGVNAFLKHTPQDLHLEFALAGIEPEPWTLADSMSVLYLMSWNNGANLKHEITHAQLVARLGEERAATLAPINLNPDEPAPEETLAVAPESGSTDETPQVSERLVSERLVSERLDPWLQDAGLKSITSPGALQLGSNNWASSAELSAGGATMLAGDPHLDPRMLPGVWYPMGLIWPGNRAVGATIPGMPGMTIGRTDFVALSVTNAYGDSQDLYLETLDPENLDHYLEGELSIPFEVTRGTLKIRRGDELVEEDFEIRSTSRGPIVSGILPGLAPSISGSTGDQHLVSLRWTATDPSMLTSTSAYESLLRARTVEDVDASIEYLPATSLNFVFADRDGGIGWRVSGQLPIRSEGDGRFPKKVVDSGDNWLGWIPFEQMPHHLNPTKGWTGTANHRTVTRDYPFYYSNYAASSFRYERLMELFDQHRDEKLTVDHFWRWQRDVVNPMARRVAPVLAAALSSDPSTQALGEILEAWDHQDRRDDAAPLVFQEVYRQLGLLIYSDELGAETAKALFDNLYYWQERLQAFVVEGGPAAESWFDDAGTEPVETLEQQIVRAGRLALERLESIEGSDPTKWNWGRRHYLKLVHPLRRDGSLSDFLGTGPLPKGGSPETLYRGGYKFNEPYATSFAASLRFAVDFSDNDKVQAVHPGGVAGRIFHPHYKDQVDAFMDGSPRFWWFSETSIEAAAEHRLVLQPR